MEKLADLSPPLPHTSPGLVDEHEEVLQERREHPRYPITLMVTCATRQRTIQVQSRDLSVGGVFLRTSAPEPICTSVMLTMRMPGGLEVEVEGLVVHTLKGVGMGVKFLRFAGSGRGTLERFIASVRDTQTGFPAVRPEDRRAHPRTLLRAAVSLKSDNNFYTGFARNVSEGGVFVATDNLLPLGSEVELQFSLPDKGPPLRVRGEVRWHRVPGAGPEAPPGMGLRFMSLTTDGQRRIEAFVARRDTLFFDDE